MAWTMVALMFSLVGFVIYYSVRLNAVTSEQRQITAELQEQNKALVCFASDTNDFEVAISELWLLRTQGSIDAETIRARDQLMDARDRLQLSAIGNGTENCPRR